MEHQRKGCPAAVLRLQIGNCFSACGSPGSSVVFVPGIVEIRQAHVPHNKWLQDDDEGNGDGFGRSNVLARATIHAAAPPWRVFQLNADGAKMQSTPHCSKPS